MATKPTGRPAGRPSKFTPELADAICEEMINGRDLTEICSAEGMPHRVTVYRWMRDNPVFATQYAHAREALADFELANLKKLADDCTEENVNSTRVKLNHFQWRVMKIAPRVYGDRTRTEVTGADGGAVKVETAVVDSRELDADQRAALRQILLAAKSKGD